MTLPEVQTLNPQRANRRPEILAGSHSLSAGIIFTNKQHVEHPMVLQRRSSDRSSARRSRPREQPPYFTSYLTRANEDGQEAEINGFAIFAPESGPFDLKISPGSNDYQIIMSRPNVDDRGMAFYAFVYRGGAGGDKTITYLTGGETVRSNDTVFIVNGHVFDFIRNGRGTSLSGVKRGELKDLFDRTISVDTKLGLFHHYLRNQEAFNSEEGKYFFIYACEVPHPEREIMRYLLENTSSEHAIMRAHGVIGSEAWRQAIEPMKFENFYRMGDGAYTGEQLPIETTAIYTQRYLFSDPFKKAISALESVGLANASHWQRHWKKYVAGGVIVTGGGVVVSAIVAFGSVGGIAFVYIALPSTALSAVPGSIAYGNEKCCGNGGYHRAIDSATTPRRSGDDIPMRALLLNKGAQEGGSTHNFGGTAADYAFDRDHRDIEKGNGGVGVGAKGNDGGFLSTAELGYVQSTYT